MKEINIYNFGELNFSTHSQWSEKDIDILNIYNFGTFNASSSHIDTTVIKNESQTVSDISKNTTLSSFEESSSKEKIKTSTRLYTLEKTIVFALSMIRKANDIYVLMKLIEEVENKVKVKILIEQLHNHIQFLVKTLHLHVC